MICQISPRLPSPDASPHATHEYASNHSSNPLDFSRSASERRSPLPEVDRSMGEYSLPSPHPLTQKLDFRPSSSNQIDAKLKRAAVKLTNLKQQYDDFLSKANHVDAICKKILIRLEYFSVNHSHIEQVLSTRSTQTDYLLRLFKTFDPAYKWLDALYHFMFQVLKFVIIINVEQDLKECEELLVSIDPEFLSSLEYAQLQTQQQLIDKFQTHLAQTKEVTRESGRNKLGKVIEKCAIVVLLYADVSKTIANTVCRCPFKIYRHISDLCELAVFENNQDAWLKQLESCSSRSITPQTGQSRAKINNNVQAAMRNIVDALKSKHAIEQKFFKLRKVQYLFGIACAGLRLLFCNPHTASWRGHTIIAIATNRVSSLAIPGIQLLDICYPLYPAISLKVDGLVMSVVEHIFARKYKPHEYSLEGYRLTLQIRCRELMIFRFAHHCFKKLTQKTNAKNKEEEIISSYMQYLEDLKKRYSDLKRKDANLIIQNDRTRHPHQNKDRIKSIVHNLKGVSVENLQPLIAFLKNYTSFDLPAENSQEAILDGIKKHLNTIFSASEVEFIKFCNTKA